MFRQLSRQTAKALPRSRTVYSRPIHTTLVPHLGPNNTEQPKNRKSKWTTSYSKMTQADAEERLGVRLGGLEDDAIPARVMLSMVAGEDAFKETKETVYRNIVDYLEVEGYPTESRADFKEANISDLVYATISPIISDFRRKTKRNLRLQREKEIVSVDSETGGTEEFVLMDFISVTKDKFVLVIEAKRTSVGEAMKQLLLAMRDAREINAEGTLYGFTTTGDLWQMVTYDGQSFKVTEQFFALFPRMDKDKKRWMKDYSVLVDCMYLALADEGNLQGDRGVRVVRDRYATKTGRWKRDYPALCILSNSIHFPIILW